MDKDLIEKRWTSTLQGLDNDVIEVYGEEFIKKLKEATHIFTNLFSSNVNLVVNDMELAVTLKYPDPAYKSRRNIFIRFILFLYVTIPESLQDVIVQLGLLYVVNFPSSLRKSRKFE